MKVVSSAWNACVLGWISDEETWNWTSSYRATDLIWNTKRLFLWISKNQDRKEESNHNSVAATSISTILFPLFSFLCIMQNVQKEGHKSASSKLKQGQDRKFSQPIQVTVPQHANYQYRATSILTVWHVPERSRRIIWVPLGSKSELVTRMANSAEILPRFCPDCIRCGGTNIECLFSILWSIWVCRLRDTVEIGSAPSSVPYRAVGLPKRERYVSKTTRDIQHTQIPIGSLQFWHDSMIHWCVSRFQVISISLKSRWR